MIQSFIGSQKLVCKPMNKSTRTYDPHLALSEFSLRPGAEWTGRVNGWTMILISDGNGYCLQPDLNQELETGAMILINGDQAGVIRASNLGGLTLQTFNVIPARLTGLLTFGEQTFFQAAA